MCGLLLGLVDICATFSQVEVNFISGVTSLNFQEGCVLTLVPQTTLIASKDGLTPESDKKKTVISFKGITKNTNHSDSMQHRDLYTCQAF